VDGRNKSGHDEERKSEIPGLARRESGIAKIFVISGVGHLRHPGGRKMLKAAYLPGVPGSQRPAISDKTIDIPGT